MSHTHNPSLANTGHESLTANRLQLKAQVLVQLIDEAVNSEGDKAEKEVALQNVVLNLLAQNEQLWQAFSQICSALSIPKGEDWAASVLNRVTELSADLEFLRKAALDMLQGKELSSHEKLELEAFLYKE